MKWDRRGLLDEAREGPSIFLHIIIIAIVTVVAVGGVIYYNKKNRARSVYLVIKEMNQQQLILARSAARGIETFFANLDDDLLTLSHLPSVQNMDPMMLKTMEVLYLGFPPQTSYRRLDKEGILHFIYPDKGWRKEIIGRDYSNTTYFKKAKETGKVTVSELLKNEKEQKRIRVVRPVYIYDEEGKREFNGLIICSFDPAKLSSLYVDTVISGEKSYAWLINDEGIFIAHYRKDFVGRDAFKVRHETNPELSYDIINHIQTRMMAGEEGASRFMSGWHRREKGRIEKLISYTPAHVLDKTWSVAVCMPVSEAEKVVREAYRKELYVIGSIIFFLTTGGIFSFIVLYKWGNSLMREIELRRKSEEALYRSEKKFRDMAENTTDLLWETDHRGFLTYVSPRVKDLLGYEVMEILGNAPFGLVQKEEQEENELFFNGKLMQKEPFFGVETHNRHKDGRIVVMETSGIPIFNEKEEFEGFRGITREVTARTEMLEVLKTSEEKFRVISEGSADGILMVDIAIGDIVYANPAICTMMGYSAEELHIMKAQDLFREQAPKETVSELGALMSGDIAKIDALTCFKKNGESISTDVRGRKITYGGRECAVAFFRDVTERKHMLEALQESEARYRLIVETTSDGLGLLDENGIFTYVNDRFFQILGYSRHDIINRSIFEFFDETNKSIMEEHWMWRRQRHHPAYEIVWTGKDDKRVPTILSPAPVFDREGRFKGSLTVITDITAHKQAKEEIQKSLKQLQKTMNSAILAIAKIVEVRDPYTAGHQERVTQLACVIARELGLSEERMKGLYLASVIHDIGKIAVPAEILSKPGQQSESEINIIKDHAKVAYDILKPLEFTWPVAQIVLQHHERMDGSGYPKGLSGNDIIFEARILGVADVVESMSTHRPYRPALGKEKALEEISRNRGILYDQDVADACINLFVNKGFEITGDLKEMEALFSQ